MSDEFDKELWPWPELPDRITKQLGLIAAQEAAEEEEEASELVDPETGEVLEGPVTRPWDLTELDGELKAAVLRWLDDVVMWHNGSYAWQEEQAIPACWREPDHAGLALDLAALAFGRIDAYQTSTAAYVGRWHSDWEDFQRRMTNALGASGRDCRSGDHKRPARYAVDSIRETISKRQAIR